MEINAGSNLLYPPNPPGYCEEFAEYVSLLAAEGACFAIGSDAHSLAEMPGIESAWALVDRLGFGDRLWTPGH